MTKALMAASLPGDFPKHTPPPLRSELLWLAVDLDGTLFRNNWTPENPDAGVGEPIWDNVTKLDDALAQGYKAMIHTARPWADYEKIEAALLHFGIPFKAIVCGKILALAYIDDRAIHASEPNWLAAIRRIEAAP